MVTARFDFPAGRYHGTRWGTHVNEVDIDWPPSPWRILRALLAMGFTRLGWSDPVPPEARRLLESLAAAPVTYHLPTGAVPAHTRHFMPQYKGSTSKVLDGFMRLPRGGALFVEWATELEADEESLLETLLSHLSYLGRAESWVETCLVEEVPKGIRCSVDPVERGDGEAVELLCPVSAKAYSTWREAAVVEALAIDLEGRQAKNQAKGKDGPLKLTSAQVRSVQSGIPVDLVEALCLDTGTLRKAGWSRPPGGETRIYWRHRSAVQVAPVRRASRQRKKSPTMALLQLTSDTQRSLVLPALGTALKRSQWIHERLAELSDGESWAERMVGTRDGRSSLQNHRHTHILPMSLGFQGPRSKLPDAPIDHLLLWCPEGYPPDAQAALLRLRRLFMRRSQLSLAVVGFGDAAAMAPSVPTARSSMRFVSRTPWVPPRYIKARGANSIEGQIRKGLASRGFPDPELIEMDTPEGWGEVSGSKRSSSWRRFELERRRRSLVIQKPKLTLTFGIRLTFSEEVQGPITLGYASHFGLGRFDPV